MTILRCLASMGVTLALAGALRAQGASSASGWQCTLLPESQLTDDCACGRAAILAPLRGTFDVVPLGQGPLFANYLLTNICFTASTNGQTYKVSGTGLCQIGGEVGVFQIASLQVQINDGVSSQQCYLTNDAGLALRLWPMMKVHLDQSNGTPGQLYRLDLAAAPFRELWFSTTTGLTTGLWPAPSNALSAGDLLSSAGHVVKRNQQLTASLGIMPVVPDLGLDAVDVLAGGEMVFSMPRAVFSETLGQFRDGDVLSDKGRVVRRYQELTAAFRPAVSMLDPGVDALQVLTNGEIYFSIRTNFWSLALAASVRKGDLLSSAGWIVKKNEVLVAHLLPADTKPDYGLAAFHVWPSGEIWFTTETGFSDIHARTYQAGDLLSDQGYVVYRNLELLATFAPMESRMGFGLDALLVVTDLVSPPPPPVLSGVDSIANSGSLSLRWTGQGRFFQLERAASVAGPWVPASPLGTARSFSAEITDPTPPQVFYRLRQW